MKKLDINLAKLDPEAIVPEYKRPGDSGFDLHCLKDTEVPPESVRIIPTGLAMAIPEGFEMQIRMRSGASLETPLILANAPGTIDSGYRGEIGIIVRNLGKTPYLVKKGDRIAQGIISPVFQANFILTSSLPESMRGNNGFGSTGKN